MREDESDGSGRADEPSDVSDRDKRKQQKSYKPKIDAYQITQSLGYQTHRRVHRRTWTKEEDEMLRRLATDALARVQDGKDLTNKEWDDIGLQLGFPYRKGKHCRRRWYASLNPNLKRGRWTEDEDAKLLDAYKRFGPAWAKVSASLEERNKDQCAKRYSEILDPRTKNRLRQWDIQEEIELIRLVKKFGTKWKSISMEMNDRPGLTCRNRWRKIITDVARGKADPNVKREVQLVNASKEIDVRELIEKEAAERRQRADSETPGPGPGPGPDSNGTTAATAAASAAAAAREHTPLTELSHSLDEQLQHKTKAVEKRFQSPVRHEPALNLNMYNFQPPSRPTTASPRPVQSRTEWKYTLSNAADEEIANGFGPIDSQESAQRLIDMAKKSNINITVHQHITHHYAPQQQSVLEPETQISRLQHFKYLPPLTEVPKLTSSASSPAGSSGGSNGKESDLLKLLNSDKSKGYRAQRSPPRSKHQPHRYSSYRASNIDMYGTSREQLFPASSAAAAAAAAGAAHPRVPKSGTIVHPKPVGSKPVPLTTEDLEEELDFWETMKTFTGQPSSVTAQPVSQHHPLHYQQEGSKLSYPGHQHAQSTTPSSSFGFGPLYTHDADDDDDDDDEDATPENPTNLYYDASRPYGGTTSGAVNTPAATRMDADGGDDDDVSSGSSAREAHDELGMSSFGFIPFNPS